MPYIVAIAGPSKSGKTTLGKRLAHSLEIPFASFGDRVRKEAAMRGLSDITSETLQELGLELVEDDPIRFCKAVLQDAGFQSDRSLVLDGIRHIGVLATVKAIATGHTVRLVYLESPFPERLKRTSLDAQRLMELDLHPVEADAPLLKAAADLVLSTSADFDKSFEVLLRWTQQLH